MDDAMSSYSQITPSKTLSENKRKYWPDNEHLSENYKSVSRSEGGKLNRVVDTRPK
jgi:hypothetical protein